MQVKRIGIVIGTLSLLINGLFINSVVGQRYVARASAPLTARSLNQLGLERVWQTQVEVDSSRGLLTYVTPHVSQSQWTTVYELSHENGSMSFDERQLDRLGRPIGIAEAQRLADLEKRVLATRDIEATVVERRVPNITLYAQASRNLARD